ncbi:MAG: competence/damage-inducible protein A, partial [Proteobacteria bacterium]|nr:competence/damage-inducible protein A [Pseudomonadota bacterium]
MNSNLRIETLAIGDELLTGKIADSNSAFVGGSLFSEGLRLVRQNVVLDKKEDILAAMSELAHRAQVVVCFGGLGPTSDDITAATIADFLGTKLIQDKSSHERLLVYLKARGRSVTEQTLKQVLIPEQTSPIPNPVGSAPGFQFEHQGCLFFFLPGVPDEMRSMFNESVLPQIIKKTARQGRVVSKVWRCIGVVESELQRLMVSVEAGLPQGMWLG